MPEAIPTISYEPDSAAHQRLMEFAQANGLTFEEAVFLLASSALQMQELLSRIAAPQRND